MDVEAIVNRAYTSWVYGKGTAWTDHMRAALNEMAQGYEHRIIALNREVVEVNERIHQLEAERVPEGWIPVSDRLPDSGVSFLAVTDCAGDIHISTMRLPVLIAKNEKQSGEFIRERVTHWMPLPAAPQQKKEGE